MSHFGQNSRWLFLDEKATWRLCLGLHLQETRSRWRVALCAGKARLRSGDPIGNQYREMRAWFKVVWVAACKLLGFPLVCHQPVAGLGRNQRRRDCFACDSQPRRLSMHNIVRRTGFIAGPRLLALPQPLHQLADRLHAVGYRSQAAHRALWFDYPDGDRLGMDIQTQDRTVSFVTGSFPLVPPNCGSL